MRTLKLFVITWNTQSNRFTETMNSEIVHQHREADYTTWRYCGHIPDFWQELSTKISAINPTVVIVAFQEDARPGSYFHSHLLPEEMSKLNYTLYDRTTLMGVGQTSVNGLSEGDVFVRGLRLSVYMHAQARLQTEPQWTSLSYTPSFFRNKGAVAIYLTLPNRKVLAIVNMHLPFDATSLSQTVEQKDAMIRQNAVFCQDQFYNEAYRKLVLEAPSRPDYSLVMGDLNYRMCAFIDWSAQKTGQVILNTLKDIPEFIKLINTYDELRQEFKRGNIYTLSEGVEDSGPLFPPTGKLKHKRDPGEIDIDAYSLGKKDQRVPSFPDRILHSPEIKCTEYARFDNGIMTKSDHAAVIGIYSILS